MSVTLEKLQEFVDKEAILQIIQDDGTLKQVTATIKAATVAGVALKEKGRPNLELTMVDKIEEIDKAPVKAKAISQKKLKPIEFGQARQHLLDRHGVELKWAKDSDEQTAFDWHAGLDHSYLGHIHVVEEPKKDEREKALAENAGETATA